MARGELTANAANELVKRISNPNIDIFASHKGTHTHPRFQAGNIASWFGNDYSSKSRLSLLDIAVVDRRFDRAIVLVEIEDTSEDPKVALGDAFGFLFGDHVSLKGDRRLSVGGFTRFLILMKGTGREKLERTHYLQTQITMIKKHMNTGNSKLRETSIDIFQDAEILKDKLVSYVEESLTEYFENYV
jgi:hypothetical protein